MLKLGAIAAACCLLFGWTGCGKDRSGTEKTETFKVWGNCEMCKEVIEKACALQGVEQAQWNIDSKLMTITYDTTEVALTTIEKKIADAGYDNELYRADDYAYDKLHSCCQYERKE